MSGFIFKLIAMVLMLIDHSYKTVVSGLTSSSVFYFMPIIGRMSFPIFAFMIAEGAHHTRDIKKYIKRLLIFALISEIPYDLAFNMGKGLGIIYLNNVIFTFLIAVVAILLFNKISNKFLGYFSVFLCCVVSYLLKCDYGWFGVLLVFCAYMGNTRLEKSILMFCAVSAYYLVFKRQILYFLSPITFSKMCYLLEYVSAAFSSLALMLYNGKRGKNIKMMFYIFYPAHLLVLGIIELLIKYLR